MKRRVRFWIIVVVGVVILAVLGVRIYLEWYMRASVKPDFFAGEIARFEANDSDHAPPEHPIVFVGSSSIRLWDSLQKDMAPFPVLNRGFGGSQLSHVLYNIDRVVIRYRPRAVVLYAGDNDLDHRTGKTADDVVRDFRIFVSRVQPPCPMRASITCPSSHHGCDGPTGQNKRKPMLGLRRYALATPALATSTLQHPCWQQASRQREISTGLTDSTLLRRLTRSGHQ